MRALLISMLVTLAVSPTLWGSDCAAVKECAAIQLWSSADSFTVEITRSSSEAGATRAGRHRQNGETLWSFQQGTYPSKQILIVPRVAILYSGLSVSAKCDSVYDVVTIIDSNIAAPLGYLAKAMPNGPKDSVTASRREEISLEPGRMYLDPGNYFQIKRPLKITATIRQEESESGSVHFEIVERPNTWFGSDETHYVGQWSSMLAASFPDNEQLLSAWLACPFNGIDIHEARTIGDLRAKRSAN